MPLITIAFKHPKAEVPKYTFGDYVAVIEDCAPRNWLIGEVVGLTLETEIYFPRWWYSIKLDAPHGLTEEYLEDDVIPATEIAVLQAQYKQTEANWVQENDKTLLPKFQPGMQVKLNAESGFQNLVGDFAVVVSSKYVSNEYWVGWTYLLNNKNLTAPIKIGEIWLELAPITAENTHNHPISK